MTELERLKKFYSLKSKQHAKILGELSQARSLNAYYEFRLRELGWKEVVTEDMFDGVGPYLNT